MSSLKKNIGLQMSYRVLTIITPLITSPIISRALGAEKIGVYSATQAYANYFMLLAMLGIEYYGQRSIASTQTRNERSVMFWEIYAVQCGASIASNSDLLPECLFLVVYKSYNLDDSRPMGDIMPV